jgi:hypothetical protein
MRIRATYRFALLAAVVLAFTVGCQILNNPVSKEDRVEMFMSDLDSGNYSSLADHVHPGHSNRDQMDSASYWTTQFGDGNSFQDSSYSESGDQVTITVESSSSEYNGTWVFTMKEDEPDVWYINALYQQGQSGNPYIPEG